MTRHAYPGSALLGDYMRAGVGLIIAIALLIAAAPIGAVSGTIFGGAALLFAAFGLRAALRHATQIEASETGVSASGPHAARIAWIELDRLSLAYYSTRRDRRDGWMQLELHGGGASIRLDSRVDGFEQLVERSARAALARGLELSTATAANLEALGISSRGFEGPVYGAAERA